MKRREFLAASIAAGAVAMPGAAQTSMQMYYEFSRYRVVNNSANGRFESYWEKAAIPALNRLGIQPVGVFRPKFGSYGLDYYVLIPHPSLESFETAWDKVAADAEYQVVGAEFIDPVMSEPIYFRIETNLMRAFKELPAIEIAKNVKGTRGRIFELRIYESHSRHKAKLKVEMFNEGGEISIFKETGLNPVMFGETLAGENMPNLTYMLGFENMAEHDAAWEAFRTSEGWSKLRVNPRYADTVSGITDIILSPAGCSQI